MANYVKVARKVDLAQGCAMVVEVGGKKVALFNDEGSYYAIANTCVHRGGPLGDGDLAGNVVSCPWHGWEYDVTSGECITNPQAKVAAYDVKLEGDDVLVSDEPRP